MEVEDAVQYAVYAVCRRSVVHQQAVEAMSGQRLPRLHDAQLFDQGAGQEIQGQGLLHVQRRLLGAQDVVQGGQDAPQAKARGHVFGGPWLK